jgi:hypothetical protein
VQSLLVWHCFSQVSEHTPSQQIEPLALPMQSDDCAHALGHALYCGLRQSPLAFNVESTFCTDVQQTSPEAVLQSVLAAQDLGHSEGGKQMGSL